MKISEIYESDLRSEIKVKLIILAKDAGIRFAEDEINHICNRMPEILREKFNHFARDTIFEAWEKGSTGQYGIMTKITVNNMISWIYSKAKELQDKNRFQQGEENFKYIEWSERHATPFGTFVCWLKRECNVYPQDIDPIHNPIIEQRVSPILKRMESDYLLAKELNLLENYKQTIINQYGIAKVD